MFQVGVRGVFFDIRKAFDTVPHQPLISKLGRIGLDPFIITWIKNYPAERSLVLSGVSSQSVGKQAALTL